MCDFSAKLIAWLDQELPVEETADVERHVRTCEECRRSLDSYKQVTGAVEAYCDAAMASTVHRGLPRWVLALPGAAAVAAAVFLAWPRVPVKPPVVYAPATVALVSSVREPAPAPSNPIKRIRRRETAVPVRSQAANWVQSEPAIRIAIPAEAMFPPGAVPEGIRLYADVSIAADGSAQRLRLRP
jgi:anti-sigma factor RsiW